MKEFFSPEDFYLAATQSDSEAMANIANLKLEAALGPQIFEVSNSFGTEWVQYNPMTATKTARVFNIKEIVYECLQHVPTLTSKNVFSSGFLGVDYMHGCGVKCANCGKYLKPEWKADE